MLHAILRRLIMYIHLGRGYIFALFLRKFLGLQFHSQSSGVYYNGLVFTAKVSLLSPPPLKAGPVYSVNRHLWKVHLRETHFRGHVLKWRWLWGDICTCLNLRLFFLPCSGQRWRDPEQGVVLDTWLSVDLGVEAQQHLLGGRVGARLMGPWGALAMALTACRVSL